MTVSRNFSRILKSSFTLAALAVVASSTSQNASAEGRTRPQAQKKRAAVVDEISGQGYGMAGCGLGSIAFGDKPGMIQIVAATVNGTFGSQTFGISSGTSNCEPGGSGHRSASLYITANRDALEKDIARGGGESLSGLASLMGCQDAGSLGSRLQSRYSAIFPKSGTNTENVATEIMSTGCSAQAIAQN